MCGASGGGGGGGGGGRQEPYHYMFPSLKQAGVGTVGRRPSLQHSS